MRHRISMNQQTLSIASLHFDTLMPILVKTRKHLLTRVPLLLVVIVIIGLSPGIIGFIGAWFEERATGQPCHEGNCGWAVMGWLLMFSIPLAGILFLICMGIVIIDLILLARK